MTVDAVTTVVIIIIIIIIIIILTTTITSLCIPPWITHSQSLGMLMQFYLLGVDVLYGDSQSLGMLMLILNCHDAIRRTKLRNVDAVLRLLGVFHDVLYGDSQSLGMLMHFTSPRCLP